MGRPKQPPPTPVFWVRPTGGFGAEGSLRVLDIAPRTSGPLRTVDTAGYIYYIRIRIRKRRIAARGAACIDMTFDMLIPESGGNIAKDAAKIFAAVAGSRTVGRERSSTESMNNELSCPCANA